MQFTGTEIQTVTYTPQNGGVLVFKDNEVYPSQPVYAPNQGILSGTHIQFNDTAITDNWSSIISKTNSSIETLNNHDERINMALKIFWFVIHITQQRRCYTEEFKYYDLTGLSNGSSLKLNGVGQNVRNRMADTIITSTHHGVTISYEVLTGIVTLNGTYTNASASNYTLAENIDLLGLGPGPGDWVTYLRYYESGTIDLNDSYIGYLLQGSGVSNRINENSESLYIPSHIVGRLQSHG